MNRHPILSFLRSFILTAIVTGLIIFGFVLLTFNLAGGETLDEEEGQHIAYLIISILLVAIAIGFSRRYFKKNKAFAYGIIVPPFLLFIAMIVFVFRDQSYTTNFDQHTWKQSTWKPEGMAKTLVKKNRLIGLTRQQVKAMLGDGSEEFGINSDRGAIIYRIENNWMLSIIFQNDAVVETIMKRPGMMTMKHSSCQLVVNS
jgi:hypothetical protein